MSTRPSLTAAQKDVIRRDYPTRGARAVAAALGVPKYMVKNFVHHAGLKRDPAHLLNRPFTDQEKEMMRTRYPDTRAKDLAAQFGRTVIAVNHYARKMGLTKSETFRASEASGRMLAGSQLGVATRFKPGIVPYSKGKPMAPHVYERAKATMFKKGNLPHNTKHDGAKSVRRDADGRQYWWIRRSLGEWVHLHRDIWERANGPVPEGFVIAFKDGIQANCVLENLECITPAERLSRTSIHNYPKDMRDAIRALARLRKTLVEHGEEHNG